MNLPSRILSRLAGQIRNEVENRFSALKPKQRPRFGEQAEERSTDIPVHGGSWKQQLGVRCIFRIAEEQPRNFGRPVAAIDPVLSNCSNNHL